MFENSCPPFLIQSPDRDDTVESSRTQHRGIQIPDVIGGTDKQYLVRLIFEQRNLFEKLVRNGLIDPVSRIAAACDLFKLIDKEDHFIKISCLFHYFP